jgi:hypothetical protein
LPSLAVRIIGVLALVAAARSANAAASLVLTSGSLELQAPPTDDASATVSEASGTIVISATEPISLSANMTDWSGDGTTMVSGPEADLTANFFAALDDVTFASDFTVPGYMVVPNTLISTDVHLSAGGNISLGSLDSTVDGSYDFVAEITGSGNISFGSAVGAAGRPRSLSFAVPTGGFIEPDALTACTGTQIYVGTLGLQTAASLVAQTITLGDVVPLSAATLTLHGDSTLTGDIGNGNTTLTSFTVASGKATFNGGSVHAQTQSYGNVVIDADMTLTGSSVHFFGTIDGAHGLTIGGDAFFSGALGGMTPLTALDVSGATTMTNAENSTAVVTTGNQHYTGAITLDTDTTWTGANVTHDNGVDGAKALTINAATTYQANGAIGSVTPLTTFAVHGPTTWAGGTLTATTSAHFFAALTLATGMTVTSPQVSFDATVDGADPLTTTGTTTFGGLVGATTPLADLTVNGATQLGAASVTNIGTQQYLGTLTVTAPSTSLSTGSFAITFGDTVGRTGAMPFSLFTTTHTGIVFASGANCYFVLAGTTAGTGYTQIVSDGAITLNDCALQVVSTATGPFPAGTQFVVLSGAPVNGTFAGLPQDAHTTIYGQDFIVDYAHGGVRLIAQGMADMGSAAAPDLAAAGDDLGSEADLGEVDLSAASASDASTSGSAGSSGCDYTLDGANASGAIPSIVAILLLLALARRRVSAP